MPAVTALHLHNLKLQSHIPLASTTDTHPYAAIDNTHSFICLAISALGNSHLGHIYTTN